MERYLVDGGRRLHGSLRVHGSKNAALPILAGALLCDGALLRNCPKLSDVDAACNILTHLGCSCERRKQGEELYISPGNSADCSIPDDLMGEMRSSIIFLGPLLAKYREAHLSFPGGCELGPRPIDLHLSSLEKMGVSFNQRGDHLDCKVEKELHGANIHLPFPSVGATENIMLAASLAKGDTLILNAAREPEINDLAAFLNAAGADITIGMDGSILIHGVEKLHAVEHRVIPDRIVGITYLCCGAITGSSIELCDLEPEHLRSVFPILEEMGCRLTVDKDKLLLRAPKELKAVSNISTMPYPGFPTDALGPVMALSTVAKGTTIFTENIFQNRFKQAWELGRMGANIRTEGRIAIVRGVPKLHGATVSCTDLRGGAALVIAALAAEGQSCIHDIRHIQRGYEELEKTLQQAGACIALEK